MQGKVAARPVPPPTAAEIDHGVPLFLDQLVDALRLGLSSRSEIGGSAILHGHDLLRQGFTVSQVVLDYGDVCQSITALAVETIAPISTDEFRMLNGCLDFVIAGAVTQYGRERDQCTIDGVAVQRTSGSILAHELRNLLQTALMGTRWSSPGTLASREHRHGAPIGASSEHAISLLVRSPRSGSRRSEREPFLVSRFIEELTPGATLAANARGIRLIVLPVELGVEIEADRQVLTAVVMNLLQNAFNFTRPRTTVTLRVGASTDRVLFEIQDECGGLPGGDDSDLFRPFEQRGVNRPGLSPRPAGGPPKRTMAGSMRATFLMWDASLLSTSADRFRPRDRSVSIRFLRDEVSIHARSDAGGPTPLPLMKAIVGDAFLRAAAAIWACVAAQDHEPRVPDFLLAPRFPPIAARSGRCADHRGCGDALQHSVARSNFESAC